MRKVLVGVLFVSALAVVPAQAQKVYIDFDKAADFSSYQTFAWAPTDETSLKDSSPLMDSRIKNGIEFQLTAGGMIENTESPDLYVTYHGEESQEVHVNTDHWGYGYPGTWGYSPYWGRGGYGGYGTSTTSVTTYDIGTLIIDIWDAKTQKIVWRGTATGTIPAKPEKAAKKIDKAINKLAKKWQKMKAKEGIGG